MAGSNPFNDKYFYRPQTKFATVMFSQMSVCLRGEGILVSVQGVSFQGVLCPGGSLSRESLSRGVSVTETPPYGNERAVRILLECILVVTEFAEFNENI